VRRSLLALRAATVGTTAFVALAGAQAVSTRTGDNAAAVRAAHEHAAAAPVRRSLGEGGHPSTDRTEWLAEALRRAPDRATIHVPAGLYHGPWTIDRPVHLQGEAGAHLRGDGRTHAVAIRATAVTLDGFEISGSGLDLNRDHAAVHITGADAIVIHNFIHDSLHGVYVREADSARIEDNTILGSRTVVQPVDPLALKGRPAEGELCEVDLNQNRRGNGIHIWNSSRHLVARNRIRDTRDGVYFSFVDRSEVRDNDIEGVRYGLHYMYSDENHFEGNVFRDNAAGAALMSSHDIVMRGNQFVANRGHRSYGVLLQTVENTLLERNRISGNTVGVFFESGHGNRLIENDIDRNHIGIHASDSSDGNQFAGNRFVGNLHTVETTGGNLTSRWTIDGRGNYWDGAVTLDLDRNGIGDVPHRELDLFGGLRRDLPAIGLLAGSPAERLLRFVHARLALPGLAGVVDTAPLIRQPRP
jgi:nitrous oxidase accessory protein